MRKYLLSVFATTVLFLTFTATAFAQSGITGNTIFLGQTAPTKGSFGPVAIAFTAGINAHLNEVNARGGVNGRKIQLISLEDEYNVEKAVVNVNKLINEDRVFGLLGVFGTAITGAALEIAEKERVPLLGPYTGADSLRKDNKRYYFSVTASYVREIEKMIDHMQTLGINSIGVTYLNSAFGKDGLAGAQKAMDKHKLTPAALVPLESNASDVEKAVSAMIKVNPSVVIMVSAGKATLEFISAYRKRGGTSQFYLLSVADVESLTKGLGSAGVKGITVTQTMPYPWATGNRIAREFQAAMKAMGQQELSYNAMQGYIGAKVMVEGLRAAGRNPTRESFVAAMENMSRLDLGGFELRYSPQIRHGSTYVDITMVSSDGRFLR
jgi:branched-chain amino acid transport system substrate-binding protein